MLDRLQNRLQVPLARLVQRGSRPLLEHLGEATDVAERRPQVMGDGVREGFQLPIGFGKLRGTIPDTLLQLFVEPADLLFTALAIGYIAIVGDDASDDRVVK